MPGPYRQAVIVGATGGIGAALLAAIQARGLADEVHAWARRPPVGTQSGDPIPCVGAGDVVWSPVDLLDEATIAAAAARADAPDLVIVATGRLRVDIAGRGPVGPEKSWRALDPGALAASFAINTIGPALVAKHLLPKLPRDRRAVFAALSARDGSITDNRLGGWYGYRASKAALNQMLCTFAIELAVRHPHAICIGLHPGTVATGLSQPFQAGVAQDKLFTPSISANHLLDVIAARSPADSGRVFDWAGTVVPA